MLEKWIGRLSIEQIIRYILIGIIDILLVIFFLTLHDKLESSEILIKISPEILIKFDNLVKQNTRLFLIIPALGFTHYLIHRFLFFAIYDTFAYIIGFAPWAQKHRWWNIFFRFKSFFLLDRYYEKADFVKFRSKDGEESAIPKQLSKYLYYRWAAIHFLFMLLEAALLFSFFGKHEIWPILVLMLLVVLYGAIPLHLYERKYYNDYLNRYK